MNARPRAELALLLVLVLAVTSLFARIATAPRETRPGTRLEDVFGQNREGLACLKRVIERSAAEGLVAEASGERSSLQEVARRVEDVRGLRFESLPTPTYVTREELSERARELAREYPEDEATTDARRLTSVGAVPPGTDLREITAETLAEQVAGFYDTDTRELVVTGDPDAGLDAFEELTLAHELEHALADQRLGVPVEEDPADGEEDANLAGTALVEGDATLTMTLYSTEGALAIGPAALLAGPAAGGLTDAPYYLERSLTFPYSEGLGFVCRLYSSGGWSAVNEAYSDPPSTTAQVLFPERYEAREPAVTPRAPASPGAGWTLDDVEAFGAADLLFLLEAPGDEPRRRLRNAIGRAEAWAGGEVHLWSSGAETATALVLVQRAGERGLCATMREWYGAAFPEDEERRLEPGEAMAVEGDGQDAVLRCSGKEVRLGIGPDLPAARRLSA